MMFHFRSEELFTLGHDQSPKPLISMFTSHVSGRRKIFGTVRLCMCVHHMMTKRDQDDTRDSERIMQKWIGTMVVTQCDLEHRSA